MKLTFDPGAKRADVPPPAFEANENFDALFRSLQDLRAAIASYLIDLANDVTGLLGLDKLNASGTRSASTFLRGDGTWASAGGSSAVTVRKIAWLEANPASTAAIGCVERAANQNSIVDATASWLDLTSAVNGAECSWGFSATHVWLDHNPTFLARIRTGVDITNVRLWFGFTSGAVFPNNDALSVSVAATGIRYSTVVPDAGFVAQSFDGLGTTTTAAFATIAASTIYLIQIQITGAGTLATFTISDTAGNVLGTTTIATRLKTGAAMRPSMVLYPQAAAQKHLQGSVLYAEYNA